MTSSPRLALVTATLVAAAVAVSAPVGSTYAAFLGRTSNGAAPAPNQLAAARDWLPPMVSGSVLQKAAGGISDQIGPGVTYHVYANAAENPASGLATVRANVVNVTSGQTAAPMAAGSWTVGGVGYGWRTQNALTAGTPLTAGVTTYAATATDADANAATANGNVTRDTVAPAASAIDAIRDDRLPDIGDTLTFTFSQAVDPHTVLAAWSGAATDVVVRFVNNDAAAAGNDSVRIYSADNSTQLPLGIVDTGWNGYVTTNNVTFGATGTKSRMTQATTTITVSFGTQTGTTTANTGRFTMRWTPGSGITDGAGNALSGTVTESNSDRDF